jgi:hypothetical protein
VDGWTLCSAEYKRVVDKVVKIVDDEHNKIVLVSFSLSLSIFPWVTLFLSLSLAEVFLFRL